MRYQAQVGFVAAAMLAMVVAASVASAASQGEGSPMTLAQAQQPATPAPTTPAPTTGAQQQPGAATTMPGQMMEHGQGMGEMGKGMAPGGQGHPGPMMGGQAHPGPAGGTPPCPPGQTASGTPPTCK